MMRGHLFFAAAMLVTASGSHAQLYFRADVGYSDSYHSQFQHDCSPSLFCGTAPTSSIPEAGHSPVYSVGVGWRFTSNIRADITGNYRDGYGMDYSRATSIIRPPSGTIISGDERFSADVKSKNLMATAYYDFPMGRVTPYLSGGIGWARNEVSNVVYTFPVNLCGVGHCEAFRSARAPGGRKDSFAWSLGGGVGIALSQRLTLDVAVRYVDLGDLRTQAGPTYFINDPVFTGTSAGMYPGGNGDLKAWELSVGLRF